MISRRGGGSNPHLYLFQGTASAKAPLSGLRESEVPFNGFYSYGNSPYVPAAINGTQEFLFTLTQKI